MKVKALLRKCRFSKRYRGYQELEECIRLIRNDEERLLCITEVYKDVGNSFRISWSGVERNIRTLINVSWKSGGKEYLENAIGVKLYEKPTVCELIEMLACYLIAHLDET